MTSDNETCQHSDWWFSRELCWCGSAHYYCTECGRQGESCDDSEPTDPPPLTRLETQ